MAGYTPTMESMGVKDCNCDECKKYKQMFEKVPTKDTSAQRQSSHGSSKASPRQDLRPQKRVIPIRRTTSVDTGNQESPFPFLPTTDQALRSGSDPTSPAPCQTENPDDDSPWLKDAFELGWLTDAAKRKRHKPPREEGRTVSERFRLAHDYDPQRDYNSVCDCTNCRNERKNRSEQNLCDCYECIMALRNGVVLPTCEEREKKAQTPPGPGETDVEAPKEEPREAPRERAKGSFPWVKRLVKTQQPDKAKQPPKKKESKEKPKETPPKKGSYFNNLLKKTGKPDQKQSTSSQSGTNTTTASAATPSKSTNQTPKSATPLTSSKATPNSRIQSGKDQKATKTSNAKTAKPPPAPAKKNAKPQAAVKK
ncbi:hypothetical protein V3C99_012631 [Haemonchus contortus]